MNKTLQTFYEHLLTIGSETTTQEELEELYHQHISVELNHHKIDIPFDAVSYNALLSFVEQMLKEV